MVDKGLGTTFRWKARPFKQGPGDFNDNDYMTVKASEYGVTEQGRLWTSSKWRWLIAWRIKEALVGV